MTPLEMAMSASRLPLIMLFIVEVVVLWLAARTKRRGNGGRALTAAAVVVQAFSHNTAYLFLVFCLLPQGRK